MVFEKIFDSPVDFFDRRLGGKCVNNPLPIVWDFELFKKVQNHFGIRAENPCLKDLGRQIRIRWASKRFLHPSVPLVSRFPLDKNRTQFPPTGKHAHT